MQVIKRHTEEDILVQAQAKFAPLSCEPIRSPYGDRLGFLIQDERTGRKIRFVPMNLDMLEQDSQLGQVLNGIRSQLLMKGFALPE